MNKIEKTLAFAFIGLASAFSPLTPLYADKLSEKSWAEVKLDIEPMVNQKERQRLERLVKKADEKLDYLKTNDRDEAIQKLQQMQALLTEEGFTLKRQDYLSEGLKSGEIDCDLSSLLILTMAERKNYPAFYMEVPGCNDKQGHAFIGWTLKDGKKLYWEATIGFPEDDLEYHKRFLEDEMKGCNIVFYEYKTKQEYLDGILTKGSAKIRRNLTALCDISIEYAREMASFYEQRLSEKDDKQTHEKLEILSHTLKEKEKGEKLKKSWDEICKKYNVKSN